MAIEAKYIREGLLYTRREMKDLFQFDNDEDFSLFIRQLKKYRIIKTKRYKVMDEDESLLSDEDEDFITGINTSDEMKYLFRFVGIVSCCDRIINVYPKYISSTIKPREQMNQVLHVLLKYKKLWEKDFFSFADDEGAEKTNLLSLILFLINDYYDNDLYINEENIFEINGDGRINWQHTIDEIDPIIIGNKPYYAELVTDKAITDENDYIFRLHATILTECSKQLQETDLMSIFGFPMLDLSDVDINSFGDKDYILNRIEAEMSMQYDNRKQLVLKALAEYIGCEGKMLRGSAELTFFGTRTFHTVWEEVCAKVFASQRNTKLGDLKDIPTLDYSFINPATKKTELIELIKKPQWHVKSGIVPSKDTFIPDYLSFDQNSGQYIYYILDAKYYCPDWTGKVARNSPGVEDIAKQYLYYLAYKPFLEHHGINIVRNYFVMPKETGKIEDEGFVELDIWQGKMPQNIGIRKLPADKMYECYLKTPIEYIALSELG